MLLRDGALSALLNSTNDKPKSVSVPDNRFEHGAQPPAAARAWRFAAKNAPAGQRQIRTMSVRRIRAGHWDDYLPVPASASGSGKDGFGRFMVSAACCGDLF
jgi:hypothetical protein